MNDAQAPTGRLATEPAQGHVFRLQQLTLKQERTRYACEILHRQAPTAVSTAAVMAWLAKYGYGENDPEGQKRNRVSPVVAAFRREHNLQVTGSVEASGGHVGAAAPAHRDVGWTDIETDASPARQADPPDASGAGHADRTPGVPRQRPLDEDRSSPKSGGAPAVSAPSCGSDDETRPAFDRSSPATRKVRFGWQAWVAVLLGLIACVLLLAGGAVLLADRFLTQRLLPPGGWRLSGLATLAGAPLTVLSGLMWRRAPRRLVTSEPLPVEVRVFYFGFAGALAASADASFRVWHDVLKVHLWEAVAFFTVVEVLLLGSGLAMRANLKRTGRPGMYGSVVWLLSGFGVVAALLVSEWPGSLWRALGGPVASVLALHLALGLELRAAGARQRFSRSSQVLRSLGEHLSSYLGTGTGEHTWILIRHERALVRAARLASKRKLTAWGRWRLSRATRLCGAGRSDAATTGLIRALAAQRATDALLTMPTVSPWDGTTLIEAPATLARRLRRPKNERH